MHVGPEAIETILDDTSVVWKERFDAKIDVAGESLDLDWYRCGG